MSQLKTAIKVAFENTTMCARSHGPNEAYNYAERMQGFVLYEIVSELKEIHKIQDPDLIKMALEKLIKELE